MRALVEGIIPTVNQEEREKVVNQGFTSYRKRRLFGVVNQGFTSYRKRKRIGKWEPSHITARPEWWSEEVLVSIRKSMLI